MAATTVTGKKIKSILIKSPNKGYALIIAIIAVTILSILLLKARVLWEREINRDLEEELIFNAGQYVTAIKMYLKKNPNQYPRNLQTLYEKKFLRKLYEDPLSDSGEWNIVMQSTVAGKRTLLIVPEQLVPKYLSKARLIGVSSTAYGFGYKEYRKKKQYVEWAFYIGENINKEIPPLKFVRE